MSMITSMMTSVCDANLRRRLVMASDYVNDEVDVDIWWRCLMAISGGDGGEDIDALNYDTENDVGYVDNDDDDDVWCGVWWLCLMDG